MNDLYQQLPGVDAKKPSPIMGKGLIVPVVAGKKDAYQVQGFYTRVVPVLQDLAQNQGAKNEEKTRHTYRIDMEKHWQVSRGAASQAFR